LTDLTLVEIIVCENHSELIIGTDVII